MLQRAPAAANADPAANETAFYKAQLEEITRDVDRGLLPQGEAEGARVQAARRLIAAASDLPQTPPSAARRYRIAAAAVIAVGLPAIAFPLYARLGQPALPDEPLASRQTAPQIDIAVAVAAVEKRLIEKPDDGKGWAVIALVYMRLERYGDAAHAYSEALRLLGEESLRRAAYGEALVAAAGGVVTDEARQAFDRALTEQPGQPQARFYRALAEEQDGKKADAARDYQSLLADSPPDAPWRSVVNARLAVNGEPAPATDADAIPEAQRPMIEGMVSRLATRLASNGGSVDEWSRLIRAYTVLHEADKAKAALADAHKALASNANAVASLDGLARDLGLGDAN
jgi:cytochrome c-type biogenesis protein CcmH